MSGIRSKNTSIEIGIRKWLFNLGLRYRIHPREIAGKPDIVFPKHKTAVLVNGCFWHLHGCEYSRIPEARHEWWRTKLEANRRRDEVVYERLQQDGWRIIIVWGCVIKKVGPSLRHAKYQEIASSIFGFLNSTNDNMQIDISGSHVSIPQGYRDG